MREKMKPTAEKLLSEKMTTSFIANPEVQLIVSSKSLPGKQKSSTSKSSHDVSSKLVEFSERELELLIKLNDLEVQTLKSNRHKTEKSLKNDKTKSFTLPEVKQLKEELGDSTFLCDLMPGTELRLPENEVIERNPVLEKRIQRLKLQQEQRVYDTMTKNVDSRRKFEPEETISYQLKQINRQLIAVAQFVFSVLAGFMFGFLGVELIIGSLDFGFRLLLGIICALVIALAEIYFLAKKLNEEMPVDNPTKAYPLPSDAIKKTN